MQVDLPYGDETLSADIPDRAVTVPTTSVGKLQAVADLEDAVKQALATPLGSPPLDELVAPGARVTIAFDDPTVMSFTPVRRMALEEMFRQLESAGVRRDDVQLICANALHRKYRPTELAHLIGVDYVEEFADRLFCHDAEDPDQLVYLGKTTSGYDIEISRHVMESDLTIYLNAAHNRGFSGGWKSVCVGLSTYRSIRHHHTPDGMSMSLHKNRMHAMLDEMGTLLESKSKQPVFKFDTVLTNPFSVAGVFAGSVWETRKAAIGLLSQHVKDRRNLASEPFDAFLYGVPNWSPYAIFASMNPLLTLISSGLGYLGGTVQALGKPDASVIMVTPCPDAWDEVHHASYPHVWEHVPFANARPVRNSTRLCDAVRRRQRRHREVSSPLVIPPRARDHGLLSAPSTGSHWSSDRRGRRGSRGSRTSGFRGGRYRLRSHRARGGSPRCQLPDRLSGAAGVAAPHLLIIGQNTSAVVIPRPILASPAKMVGGQPVNRTRSPRRVIPNRGYDVSR